MPAVTCSRVPFPLVLAVAAINPLLHSEHLHNSSRVRLLTQVLVLCVLPSLAAAKRVPSGKVSGAPTLADPTTGKEMSDCQMAPNVDAAKALLASSTMDEVKRRPKTRASLGRRSQVEW